MTDSSSPHFLFRRCVQCPDTTPSCPHCADDEICSQISQTCQQCSSTQCVKSSESGATNNGQVGSSGSKTNIGAIAGGVIGGVVFIVIVAFLIWKFWLKGKRRSVEEDYEFQQEEKAHNPEFGMHRSARASTHTVQSMASTVLTRASNIIQIAYIPGVTNRSTASPGLLVPPVPPIPSATPVTSPYRDTADGEQVFFTAGDIRDSTYSGMTGYTGVGEARDSIAPSLAARGSVASTIYRSQAQVSPLPAPTQTMIRGKAAVVSVNGSVNRGNGSSASSANNTPIDTPPVPSIDFVKHGSNASSTGPRTVQVRMPASTDALGGPSPSNSVKTVTIGAKAVPLNIVKRSNTGSKKNGAENVPVTTTIAEAVSKAASDSPKGLGLRQSTATGATGESHERARRIDETATEGESSDEDSNDHERSRRSLLGKGRVESTQSSLQSPFGDSHRVHSSEVPTLSNLRGKAKQRTEADDEHERRQSPFEDSNALP